MADELIPGATSSAYTLTALDVGRDIYCRVTATNVAGQSSASAVAVGPISAAPAALPINTTAPAVSGSVIQGSVLTTTDGIWGGSPAPTFTRQWKSGATDVGTGATTYTTVLGDIGFDITCVVTATNFVGAVPATSNSKGPIEAIPTGIAPANTTLPNIADTTPSVSVPITSTSGIWAGDLPITYSYEWHRVTTGVDTSAPVITSSGTVNNTENIVLAHALTATDASAVNWSIVGGTDAAKFEISGTTLRWLGNVTKNFEAPDDSDTNGIYVVNVRATDLASNFTNQTITVTLVDAGDPPTLLAAPVVTPDPPTEGVDVSCTTGTWDGDPTITFSYEWHKVTV